MNRPVGPPPGPTSGHTPSPAVRSSSRRGWFTHTVVALGGLLVGVLIGIICPHPYELFPLVSAFGFLLRITLPTTSMVAAPPYLDVVGAALGATALPATADGDHK